MTSNAASINTTAALPPTETAAVHSTAAVPPRLVSRFSDATTNTLGANSTPAETPGATAVVADPFEEQRVVAAADPLGDEPSRAGKIDPATLVTPTVAGSLVGFQALGDGSKPTVAMEDFAHLSQQTRSPVSDAGSTPTIGAARDGREDYKTAAVVGAGGAGLGLGALAAHEQQQPISAIPIRPQFQDSPSTPSSTRAIKGSPVGTPAPASYVDSSPTTAVSRYREELPAPVNERSSHDAQREVGAASSPPRSPVEHVNSAGNPVVLSPHMKIAKREDGSGHNRLHKKGADKRHDKQHHASPGSSPRISGEHQRMGSPRGNQGEAIWNGSVAHVVDEQEARSGHRSTLVHVDPEDRRDNVMDRMTGVNGE